GGRRGVSEVVGVRRPRVDGPEKAAGATRYAADGRLYGLLHARLVLASEPHALLRGVEAAAALAVPGVVAVLTAADLPTATSGTDRTAEPLAREEVVFEGQPVAIVVAESEAAAEDGAELVAVELETLPAVVDLEEAIRPGAPLARRVEEEEAGGDLESIHAGVDRGEEEAEEEQLSGNVLGRVRRASGDVAAALAASDAVVSGTFRTPWVYQAYVEPQVATAWLEPDGTLVVSTSTQGSFVTRSELARAFGLPLDRVRVTAEPLGGAFGGKFALVEPLVAGAALALRRPVRLVLTRSEDFRATNPVSAEILELEVGARADGTLTGLRGRILVDRGTNAGWGLEGITSLLAGGPYRWQAHDLRGYGVQTNRVTFGAYRGPGAPPAAFALESLLDELAAALDLDPLELRLRNAAAEGDVGVSGNPFPVIGTREVLERVREHPLWQRRGELPPDEGVGVAVGYWPGGNEPAAAVCRVDADGTLTVVTSAVDMSGVNTGFATIAAATFGVPPDAVRVVTADTASGPYAGASGGSKVTYTVGKAVERAAAAAREKLLAAAAEELEIAPADLEVVDGVVRAKGAPDRSLTVEELARRTLRFGGRHEPIEGHGGSAQTSGAPSAAAHLSHVRVDRETGEVRLLRHVVAQDVGRALNPALVEGQMLGGAVQGIGWALYEQLAHDERGYLLTGSFLEYALPTAERVPPLEALIVEVPAPDGPFGAKGIGEAPVVAAAPAIANAVAAATGVRLRELPLTPPRVWAALRAAEGP
ncbi:MAG TPA: xanthine dehydrogenase family protein molybdopterin-binding subunit, partial [Gaiellaceae bacterium]|nr:xanthine dehydrogenase family protein molybdopterin-binding subunit [Gaiellaceae bacterium]